MLATLIIRCPLIRLGRGLRSAHTYSCEGRTSRLHGTAYGHESGVTAKQALGRSQQGIPRDSLESCALHLAMCESPGYCRQQLMSKFNRGCLKHTEESWNCLLDVH